MSARPGEYEVEWQISDQPVLAEQAAPASAEGTVVPWAPVLMSRSDRNSTGRLALVGDRRRPMGDAVATDAQAEPSRSPGAA